MTNWILLIVSFIVYIAVAIWLHNDLDTSPFETPVDDRGLTWQVFASLLYLFGACWVSAMLQSLWGVEQNKNLFNMVLPIALMIITSVSIVYGKEELKGRDLKTNGFELTVAIDSTSFKWTRGHHDKELNFGYSYHFILQDSLYQFTRWDEITRHRLSYAYDKHVTYEMLPNYSLLHPGDSIRIRVSSINPENQLILN